MPRVAQATLSSPEFPSVFGTELPTPLADGFVADDNPTLGQKIFNISEAQAEAVVEPNGMTDNIRWKSVAVITERVGFHLPSLPGFFNLTIPSQIIPPSLRILRLFGGEARYAKR